MVFFPIRKWSAFYNHDALTKLNNFNYETKKKVEEKQQHFVVLSAKKNIWVH